MVPAKKRSRFESAALEPRRCVAAPRRPSASSQPLERQLEAAAQLRGGLAREGDGRHVLDLIDAGRDAGGHPLGEHLRLAGAGAGLDEEVGQQLLADERGATARRCECASLDMRRQPPVRFELRVLRASPRACAIGRRSPHAACEVAELAGLLVRGARERAPVAITSRRSASTAAMLRARRRRDRHALLPSLAAREVVDAAGDLWASCIAPAAARRPPARTARAAGGGRR